MSIRKFYTDFQCNTDCVDFLKRQLEKSNICCTKCGNSKLKWNDKQAHWRCKCMRKISPKSLTFMRDSNISLLKWFEAIFLITDSKKSLSHCELSNKLGIKRYATVQYLALKINKQMSWINSKLFFNESINYNLDLDILNQYSLKVRLNIVRVNQKGKDLIRFDLLSAKKIAFPFLIRSPKLNNNYPSAKGIFKPLTSINPKWNNILKQNFSKIHLGIHHQVSIRHLQYYLDQYCYKYNNRHSKNKFIDFMNLLLT